MKISIQDIVSDFERTLPLAGIDSSTLRLEVLDRDCPHKSKALPRGMMAIYIFILGEEVLKIGKVGPNSNARFQNHHYSPESSGSNLAKSLLDDEASECRDISADEIGSWMREHLQRIDILVNLDVDKGILVLAYLEAFLHCRLKPKYEGFKTQKL